MTDSVDDSEVMIDLSGIGLEIDDAKQFGCI